MITVRARAEIEIQVDVPGFNTTIDSGDVLQAVQDAIGHTGAIVEDVTEWTEEAAE